MRVLRTLHAETSWRNFMAKLHAESSCRKHVRKYRFRPPAAAFRKILAAPMAVAVNSIAL
jgi:hypothetical protein